VKEKCDLDYEPAGEVNSNLVELLKTKSAKFAELIVRQVFYILPSLSSLQTLHSFYSDNLIVQNLKSRFCIFQLYIESILVSLSNKIIFE